MSAVKTKPARSSCVGFVVATPLLALSVVAVLGMYVSHDTRSGRPSYCPPCHAGIKRHHGTLFTVYEMLSKTRTTLTDKSNIREVTAAMALLQQYLQQTRGVAPNRGHARPTERATDRTLQVTDITLLLDFTTSTNQTDSMQKTLLDNIGEVHTDLKTVVAINKSFDLARIPENATNIMPIIIANGAEPVGVWSELLTMSSTPLSLVGYGMVYFDKHARLNRLLDVLMTGNTVAVGGASRTTDGHWRQGCEQYVMRNYTLAYTSGYARSKHSCVYCNHLDGPFLMNTAVLKRIGFDRNISTSFDVTLRDFFIRLNRDDGRDGMVCPDSMFHVSKREDYSQNNWRPLGHKWELDLIKIDSHRIQFPCRQQWESCALDHGTALSPCCMRDLADQVKVVMKTCVKFNVTCSLDSGTLLGAIKFSGALPWERDADIAFAREHWKIVNASVKPYLVKTGYRSEFARDVVVGLFLRFYNKTSAWKVEYVSRNGAEFEDRGFDDVSISPTMVNFDGMWVRSYPNPGLTVYLLYEKEIYKHSQHNMVFERSYGSHYVGGRPYTQCNRPGHHSCLGQYSDDGNLQLSEPAVETFCY